MIGDHDAHVKAWRRHRPRSIPVFTREHMFYLSLTDGCGRTPARLW